MTEINMVIPIHRAIKRGDLPEVIGLIADNEQLLRMVTPFGTWLQDAASQGQLTVVKWFVSKGLDVNAYDKLNPRPPLAKAADFGHVDVVRYLIDAGAVLDTSDPVRNPLLVGERSNTAVAKLLIDSGIDTLVKYSGEHMHDMHALAFAREWGREDIIEMLMEIPRPQ